MWKWHSYGAASTGWSLRSRPTLRHDSAMCHPLRQELGGSRVAAEYFEVPFYCTSDRGKGQHQTTNDEDMAIFTEHLNWDEEPVKPLSWGAESRRLLLQDVTESDSPGGFALVSRMFSFWKSISPFALYDVYLGYPGPFESLNMWMFSKHCPKGQRLSRKYLAGNYISNISPF